MGRAVALFSDFCGDALRRLPRKHKDAACTRRLLTLSLIHDGESRSEAALSGGVGLEILSGTGYYVLPRPTNTFVS